MSERERWIVYPLLFLALGTALRDKMIDRTWSRNVVCEELLVVDGSRGSPSAPPTVAHLGRIEKGGRAPSGQLSVDVVRAGEVIADRYSYGRRQVTVTPGLFQWLNRLRESAQKAQAMVAEEQPAPDTEASPPPYAQ